MKKLLKILKKKMKSLTIFSLILSSFLFINKVSALSYSEYPVFFDIENQYFIETYSSLKPKMDSLIDVLQTYYSDSNYFVYFGRMSGKDYLFVDFVSNDVANGTGGNYTYSKGCYFSVNSNGYYSYNYTGCKGNKMSISYSLGYSSESTNKYNNFDNMISYIINNKNDIISLPDSKSPLSQSLGYSYASYFKLSDGKYPLVSKDGPYVVPYYSNGVYLNNNGYSGNSVTTIYPILINNNLYSDRFYFDGYFLSSPKPEINFSYKNNIDSFDNSDYITSVDLTIDYGLIDNDKYIYMYKYESDDFWYTLHLIDKTDYTINVKNNSNIIARILDKESYDNVDTKVYSILNISIPNSLKLYKTFNSGDFGDDLHSLDIYSYDSSRIINFKIQFGPNNFDGNFSPRVSGIKSYLFNSSNQSRIESNDVYIKDFTCYKELEQDVETWCTGSLVNNIGGSAFYQIFFENTSNYYLYYYDNISDNSKRRLDVTSSLFKDYTKYYFNSNSDKAYINLKNINQEVKKGSVILPYYYVNNDDLSVSLRQYSFEKNDFIRTYFSIPIFDEYYTKFDFSIDDDTMPVLTNKKGRYCVKYYTNSDAVYNYISLNSKYGFGFHMMSTWYLAPFQPILLNNLFDTAIECYEEEPVYFYVSNDFKVTFNTIGSSNSLIIQDNYFNNIGYIDSNFNNTSPYLDSNSSFFDSVKNAFSYFITPIREFLRMISYFWASLNPILQFFFIFIFTFIVALFIFKFIL